MVHEGNWHLRDSSMRGWNDNRMELLWKHLFFASIFKNREKLNWNFNLMFSIFLRHHRTSANNLCVKLKQNKYARPKWKIQSPIRPDQVSSHFLFFLQTYNPPKNVQKAKGKFWKCSSKASSNKVNDISKNPRDNNYQTEPMKMLLNQRPLNGKRHWNWLNCLYYP